MCDGGAFYGALVRVLRKNSCQRQATPGITPPRGSDVAAKVEC